MVLGGRLLQELHSKLFFLRLLRRLLPGCGGWIYCHGRGVHVRSRRVLLSPADEFENHAQVPALQRRLPPRSPQWGAAALLCEALRRIRSCAPPAVSRILSAWERKKILRKEWGTGTEASAGCGRGLTLGSDRAIDSLFSEITIVQLSEVLDWQIPTRLRPGSTLSGARN
jgi:hypothetical protein